MDNNFKELNKNKLISWGLMAKIKKELIIDSYIDKSELPTQEEKENLLRTWIENMEIRNESEYYSWLKINGFTEETFQEYLARDFKWTKWCINHFKDEIKSYYIERKNDLDELKFMLIRVSCENLANELYLRIKEEENTFTELAEQYSEGPERRSRGIIGPAKKNILHPELVKFLSESNKDELNHPIKIDSNFFITKLLDIKIRPLDKDLKMTLSKELGDRFILEKLKHY